MFNLFNLLAETSSSAGKRAGMPMWVIWVVLIGLCLVMFFVSSRQRKKQQAQMEERMNALAVGDRIKTIGLIVATIEKVNEDGTLLISTGDDENKTYLTIEKNAVYQTIPDESAYAEEVKDVEDQTLQPALSEEDVEDGIEVEDVIEEAIADDEEDI